MRRRLIAASVGASLLMCGCSDAQRDVENIEFSGSYHMISEGTSVAVFDDESVPGKSVHASFYIPDGMETVYASEHISSENTAIYAGLLESIGNFEPSAVMSGSSADYTDMLNIIGLEQLSYSHLIGRKAGGFDLDTNKFIVDFIYRFSPEEMSNMNRASESVANEIIKNMPEGMSDYDKLKYFHDYLIQSCESDTVDEYAGTVYGALVRGKAICEGYAKSFSYLCNKVGIENVIVAGETTEPHMWNIVKIDGNWYHIDVTWDKPEGVLAERFPDTVLYQYFMVTDSVIENDHTIWSIGCEPPHAYSTKENYFYKEGMYVSSQDGIASAAENALRSAVQSGSHTAMIKFDTTNLMLSAMRDMNSAAETGEVYLKDIIDRISEESGKKFNLGWTDYYTPYRIIVFVIEYK